MLSVPKWPPAVLIPPRVQAGPVGPLGLLGSAGSAGPLGQQEAEDPPKIKIKTDLFKDEPSPPRSHPEAPHGESLLYTYIKLIQYNIHSILQILYFINIMY